MVGVSPLLGKGLDREKVAANIQSALAEDLAKQHVLDLTEYLDRNFIGSTSMKYSATLFKMTFTIAVLLPHHYWVYPVKFYLAKSVLQA